MKRYFAIGGVGLLGLSYMPVDDPSIVYLKILRSKPCVTLAKMTNNTNWLNNTLISGADFNSIKRDNKFITYSDHFSEGLIENRYSPCNCVEFYQINDGTIVFTRNDFIFDVEIPDSAYVEVYKFRYKANKVILSNKRDNIHKTGKLLPYDFFL